MSFILRTAQRSADEIAEARAALNEGFRRFKSIGALYADRQFIHYAGTLIRQLAQDKFNISDPTPLLFERRPGPGLGNQLEIEEFVNTAKVTICSLGNKPKTFTPHKKKYGIALQDYDLHFALELERILTGEMDASILVDHMAEAISRHYVAGALSAIDAACTSSTFDAYGNAVRTASAGGLQQSAVDAALKRLGDVNSDIVIAGRYSTLFPLLDFDGYSNEALEEIRSAGMIGRYKGATVVVLRDSYNPFYKEPAVPADRVYFAGADKGGLFVEEDMSRLDYEVVDPEEQHLRLGTRLRSTFSVMKPWRYHVIEIT